MRRLSKLSKPQILLDNEAQWTRDYLEAVANGDTANREKWRHKAIKERLSEEVQTKCAYCEGFVEDVSYPHVEHLVPKIVAPELAHVWENLTSSCGPCNINKGSFYEAVGGLLQPYRDDPEQDLVFLGPLISWMLGSGSGEVTVRQLQLNRLPLVNARTKRLEALRESLERWHAAVEPLRSVLAEALRADMEMGEYTMAAVSLARIFEFET